MVDMSAWETSSTRTNSYSSMSKQILMLPLEKSRDLQESLRTTVILRAHGSGKWFRPNGWMPDGNVDISMEEGIKE